MRSESQSYYTDVDVTSGGLIPCAGHGKFRSETASSDSRRASAFEFGVEQSARDINPVPGKSVRRTKPNRVCPVDLS